MIMYLETDKKFFSRNTLSSKLVNRLNSFLIEKLTHWASFNLKKETVLVVEPILISTLATCLE